MRSKNNRLSLPNKIALRIASRAKRRDEVALSQRNIYIFPSASGLGFLLLLVLMLVTAINYQSSLVYLLTFLFGALFFVSILLCYFNLQGLQVMSGQTRIIEAGESPVVQFKLLHRQRDLYGLAVSCVQSELHEFYVRAGVVKVIELPLIAEGRGVFTPDRVYLETRFPFGLVRGWTWLKLNAQCCITPVPNRPPEVAQVGGEGGARKTLNPEASLDLVRPYTPQDKPSRVLWKKYASSGQLVVRDAGGTAVETKSLTLDLFEGYGLEQSLSFLYYMARDLDEKNEAFALDLAGQRVPLGQGKEHFRQCRELLAGYAPGEGRLHRYTEFVVSHE